MYFLFVMLDKGLKLFRLMRVVGVMDDLYCFNEVLAWLATVIIPIRV